MSATTGPYHGADQPRSPIDERPPHFSDAYFDSREDFRSEFVSLYSRALHILGGGLRHFLLLWVLVGFAVEVPQVLVGPTFLNLGDTIFGVGHGPNLQTIADFSPSWLTGAIIGMFGYTLLADAMTIGVPRTSDGKPGGERNRALPILSPWLRCLGGPLVVGVLLLPVLLLEVMLTLGGVILSLFLTVVLVLVGGASIVAVLGISLFPVIAADQGCGLIRSMWTSWRLTDEARLKLLAMDLVPVLVLTAVYSLTLRPVPATLWFPYLVALGVANGAMGTWFAANRIALYLSYTKESRGKDQDVILLDAPEGGLPPI